MKILDIALPLSPKLPVWPNDPRIVLERYREVSKGDASNDSRIACSVHAGTHVDAPAHFFKNGITVEHLSLDMLMGPAVLTEIPDVAVITPDILEALKLSPQTTHLLIKTRNSALWADPHHNFDPGYVALSPEAARWIVRWGIGLVGIDYLSIQMFDDDESLTHRILLKAGVIIVEGLNLRDVQPGNYQFICLPVKLIGSDGAPVRAVLVQE